MLTKSTINKIKNLDQKKFRERFSEFVVEGIKGVQEAIDSDAEIFILLGTESALNQMHIPSDIEVQVISEQEGRQVSSTDTFSGVLAVVAMREESELSDGPIICLDKIADPGNLGTIIRTADWFGIKNILLSENSVDPYNPKVVRSTMGSIFRINIEESEDIIRSLEDLKKRGYNVISLTMNGKNISRIKANQKNVYVFGSESHGVRPEIVRMGESYTIPGRGNSESLNVGVAVGIVLAKLS